LKKDRILAVALGIALAVGFIWSQRPHPREHGAAFADPSQARQVTTMRVPTREIQVLADAVGTVRSRRQTQIAARVLAEVKEILKQPGDSVEEGDVLIVLDSRDLQARVAQAEATLRATQETLQERQTEFDRKKNLLEKEAATQREFDMAKFELAAVTARKEAADKALEEARILLGYATIRAPFEGVIYEKHADPGDLSSPGKPLLGLYDPEALRLEALVEETLLWKVQLQDQLQVKIDVLDEEITGTVSEAVPAVDPATRTGTVKIDLPKTAKVRPGMFGRARIPVSRREAVVVPRETIVERGQLELAFVVDKTLEAGGVPRARMLLVRLGPPLELHSILVGEGGGASTDAPVEVIGGLEEGQVIVASGASALREGTPLEITSGPTGDSDSEGTDAEGSR
jgi:RND family efflux transporter MFP subunit